jgi:hypothetical protein
MQSGVLEWFLISLKWWVWNEHSTYLVFGVTHSMNVDVGTTRIRRWSWCRPALLQEEQREYHAELLSLTLM